SIPHALAIGALARIGKQEMGIGNGPAQGGPPEAAWRPRTWDDWYACAQAALARLQRAAALPDVDESLARAAVSVAMLLRHKPLRDSVAEFLRAVAGHHPPLRERVWREVDRVVRGERKHWKELPADYVEWLQTVCDGLA